jgi:hypothetical protein
MRIATAAFLFALPALASPQVGSLDAAPARTRQYVSYAAEQQVVPAGKRAVLELRFRVQDGFHVNSHTPRSELLIPTVVDLQPAPGVTSPGPEYPAGMTFSFSFAPNDKIDVYENAFTVKLPVVAKPGAHQVQGALKYQACDHTSCYPPRTLPIVVNFAAK